jgi:amylosucrase
VTAGRREPPPTARAIAAARRVLPDEAPRDRELFELRLERYWPDLHDGLVEPYGGRPGFDELLDAVATELARRHAERPEDLRRLDLRRLLQPDWFQRPEMVGYVCYADRFAGTLRGVADRVPYLEDLGVRYLHLMPLLASRPAPNDGGYAVLDYLAVEPRLGTVSDLDELGRVLRDVASASASTSS